MTKPYSALTLPGMAWRHLYARRVSTWLNLLGIALGLAAVLATDITNRNFTNTLDGLVQLTMPVIHNGTRDDPVTQRPESPAGIGGGIDHTRKAQTIEVLPGEETVSGWAPFNRRDQSPIRIEADRVGVDAGGAGKADVRRNFAAIVELKLITPLWGWKIRDQLY